MCYEQFVWVLNFERNVLNTCTS